MFDDWATEKGEKPIEFSEVSRFVAGFDLAGYKLPDGTFQLGTNHGGKIIVKEIPKLIKLGGTIYTLEEVKEFKGGFINAVYV
jgi:hypothetical protein